MSEDEVCGAELKTSDGFCTRSPSQPDGRCGFHSEINQYGTGTNNNNFKHGLFGNRSGYYETLPEKDQRFIDAVADELIEKSYYEKSDLSMMEKCREVAISMHQRRRADEYIANKGMTMENEVGFHEQYGPITEEKENVLFITKDRLDRETRLTMKDMGILDDDHADDEGGSSESLIEKLSQEMSDV